MIESPALLVLLAVAATVRLTRLVTSDVLLDRPRASVQRAAPDSIAYLVTCPWCVSVWLGTAVAAAVYAWHAYSVIQVLLIGLAGSLAAGLLSRWTED